MSELQPKSIDHQAVGKAVAATNKLHEAGSLHERGLAMQALVDQLAKNPTALESYSSLYAQQQLAEKKRVAQPNREVRPSPQRPSGQLNLPK